MKKSFKKTFIFIGILFILLKIGTSIAQEKEKFKEISLKPSGEVKQGQTVFINIKSPEKLVNPAFVFNNKKYKLFNSGENQYSGLLGVEALTNPGTYTISLTDETGNLKDQAIIKVSEKKFPSQNIAVSKGTAGLTATQHENNQINRMKTTVTDDLLGAVPPYNSPTAGCINSVFGVKRYYNGKFSGNYHKGIDIRANKGVPVKSITDGKILFAEFFRLHGGSVAVDHGQGLVSLYIHLSKIDVKAGDKVTSGQKVGEVGSTGFATGPHLHWGLYVHGTSIDPMTDWIKPVTICK
ncbi:MAG: hypothetical protein A2Y25_10850 [Candidatus Melainabacteria bacterium GWF2_37_15]|nr:MAG: hypothetical protein A2Y25_10850 [Candidatus Melainabacteria bacterium GWF2_37_15]